MELCIKYKPELLSELEYEYPKIIEYLNLNKTFIINGKKSSGKSTITKLYLKLLNYDYLLLDDYSLTKDQIYEKIKFRTNSVFSYFYNKKYTIVVDNFDLFNSSVKDFIISNSEKYQYIIITQKYLNSKFNYIYINNYSQEYLIDIYNSIFLLETDNIYNRVSNFNNITQMFSILEFDIRNCNASNETNVSNASNASNKTNVSNVSNVSNESNNFKLFFDEFNFNLSDVVNEKNFGKKLYIIDKINAYNTFHDNIAYNYNSIDDLSESYDYLSNSLLFLDSVSYCNINSQNLEYYSILSIIGTTYKLNDFKIYKENFQIRKKKIFKYY